MRKEAKKLYVLLFTIIGAWSGRASAGAPANDDCDRRLPIFDGTTQFDSRGANTDGPAEVDCNFLPSDLQINQDIWYGYVASCTGQLTVSLCDTADPPAGFDTKVAVYLGTTCPPPAGPLACDDDGCDPVRRLTSTVMLRVNRGQRYTIRIGGYLAAQGAGTANITCQPDEPACYSSGGDCCAAHASPGCADAGCCERVCSLNPACCDTTWDGACASLAAQACTACGGGDGEDCIGCIPLYSREPYEGTTVGASGMNLSICDQPTPPSNPDVWHCWRADCTGEATISLCGSDYDTTLSVFDACGGEEVICNDDGCPGPNTVNSRLTFRVTAGTLFYVRVAGFRGDSGDYTLTAVCDVGPPNDRCTNANPIRVGETPFSTEGATTDGPPLPTLCNEGFGLMLGKDIWYDFVPDCSGIVTVSTCNAANFDTRLAVYEGCNCPAQNSRLVACNDDAGTCGETSEMSFAATAGTCYKLRVGGYASFSGTASGSGTLRISCGQPIPNDDCEDAPVENLPHTFTGNNTVASNDCADTPGGQVWIAFRVTESSNVRLEYCGSTPPFDAVWLELVEGCPCREFSMSAAGCFICDDGNAALEWTCLPAGTYYYPVLSEPGSRGAYTIDVTAVPCIHNDLCSQAFPIADGDTLFTTGPATTDGPALPSSCNKGAGTSLGKDIWFDYAATCEGRAVFSTCDSADYDTRLAVYREWDCPVSNTRLIGCNDDDHANCEGSTSRLVVDVVEGGEYKLRLGGFAEESGSGCVHVECVPSCPDEPVMFVITPDQVVDARQPQLLSGGPLLGIDGVRLVGPGPMSAFCFEPCETAHKGLPSNSVTGVTAHGDGSHTVQLARPVSPGEVTTLTYLPNATTASIISHPGNVDGNPIVDSTDVDAFLRYLNNSAIPPWGVYSIDLDRSGVMNPQDLARLLDLMNGANAFDAWNSTSRPNAAGICP